MQGMQVRSQGWENPLEKEMGTHLSRKSHGQRNLVCYSPGGRKRVGHDLATQQQQQIHGNIYPTKGGSKKTCRCGLDSGQKGHKDPLEALTLQLII